MKRIFTIIFAMLMLISASMTSSSVLAEETNTVKLTFVLPDGHYYLRENGSHTFSSVLECEKGTEITAELIEKFYHHCESAGGGDVHKFCHVSITGFEPNPIGITATEDMTFTAIMNSDTADVTVKMSEGAYNIEHFTPIEGPDDDADNSGRYQTESQYTEFKIEVDKGYTLTEDDVKRFSTTCSLITPGSVEQYAITGFDKEPAGYMINEDTTFVANAKCWLYINYYIPTADGVFRTESVHPYMRVLDGGKIEMSDLPDINRFFEDSNPPVYSACYDITQEQLNEVHANSDDKFAYYIPGKAFFYGDATEDRLVNTADAVAILKHIAGITTLSDEQIKIGDINRDKTLNTADAVKVLKYAANM